MKKLLILSFVAASAGAHAQLNLFFVKRLDVSATADAVNNAGQFIGSNPSAVAWNGSDLYLAGFNGGTTAANAGMIKVTDALNTAVLGSTFGALSTPSTRGFTGLAFKGGRLAASWDNGSTATTSLRSFDANGNLVWDTSASGAGNTAVPLRGIAGISYDPGFNGNGAALGSGVAFLTTASGRRQLYDAATGAQIYSSTTGAIINFAPVSTTWRDSVFDPATGDLYTRESNRVGKAVRSGDNKFVGDSSTVIGSFATAGTIVGQNIEFIAAGASKFLMVNDRPSTAATTAGSAIKVLDTSGNAVAFNVDGSAFALSTLGASASTGFYDFSWDAASGSLAIMDFSNRTVSIYSTTQPVPEPASLAALALGGAALLRRRKR